MNDETTLDYFLAADEGAGRCIKSLITFLISLQNEFLSIYQRMPNSFVRNACKLAVVQESDIIMYSQKDDLLPIIHLNCDYSLEIGKGTRIEYNLDKIEHKLMEKICYGKCPIETPVQMFQYRDDVHKIEEFNSFFQKVQQVLRISNMFLISLLNISRFSRLTLKLMFSENKFLNKLEAEMGVSVISLVLSEHRLLVGYLFLFRLSYPSDTRG